MAVVVNYWAPKLNADSSFNIGHASILVESPPKPIYFSVWPDEKLLSFLFGAGAQYKYEADVKDEGGPPNQVRLTKLDEAKIIHTIEVFKSAKKYSFLMLNCAVQASLCLHAGVPKDELNYSG